MLLKLKNLLLIPAGRHRLKVNFNTRTDIDHVDQPAYFVWYIFHFIAWIAISDEATFDCDITPEFLLNYKHIDPSI